MAVFAETPIELVNEVYSTLDERLAWGREKLGRAPYLGREDSAQSPRRSWHCWPRSGAFPTPTFAPTGWPCKMPPAQMAWLQFMTAGLARTSVPTTTHCDHLIQARVDGKTDLMVAADTKQRGLRLPRKGLCQVRRRLLGTRFRHHPSGRARELRLPRRHDARHR